MNEGKSEKLEGNSAPFYQYQENLWLKTIDNDYHYQYRIVRQTITILQPD